jgi:phosphoserine phosphatase
MSNESKYVFCDVCDTVYRSNTTFDFLNFFLAQHSSKKLLALSILTGKWSPALYFLLILGKVLKVDLVKIFSLKLLNGYTRKCVEESAVDFVRSFLNGRVNKEVVDLLRRKSSSERIIFISSSIDPVVRAVSEEFGFPFYASTLSTSNGILNGALSVELAGTKHKVVSNILGDIVKASLITVITDNRSDFDLVSMAGERYIVISNDAQKKFWRKLDPEFIMI